MWVEVVDVAEDGYVGRLDNDPVAISDLAPGSLVHFSPRHVAALWREAPTDPHPEDLVIVSDLIWVQGALPAVAVRLPESGGGFSGWVLLAEGDAEPPPADLAGYSPVSHAALTDRYRAFDSIEDEAPGSSWRWDAEGLEWTAAPAKAAGVTGGPAT
jgi:hypothetical protein